MAMSTEQLIEIARTAATAHYQATANPDKSPSFDDYWQHNPIDRAIWFEIVRSILIAGAAHDEATRAKAGPVPLPGLGAPLAPPGGAIPSPRALEAAHGPDFEPQAPCQGLPGSTVGKFLGAKAGFLEGLDMGEVERREIADWIAQHDGRGNMPARRLASVRKMLSLWSTAEKVAQRAKADIEEVENTIFWVNPVYFGLLAGQGRVIGIADRPPLQTNELDYVCVLKDGTLFRISPITPSGGLFRACVEGSRLWFVER